MDITITKYSYERVETDVVVTISDKPIYCFQTGVRLAYAITPQWTTWNVETYNKPEEIYEYQIIQVGNSYGQTIEIWRIRTSDIPELINGKCDKRRFCCEKMTGDEFDLRTKEQFMKDYNSVINTCKEFLTNG